MNVNKNSYFLKIYVKNMKNYVIALENITTKFA